MPQTKIKAIEEKQITPITIRLPAPGTRCPWTGLSRSSLAELCVPCEANDHRPQVKSIVQKKRGASRGIRLIDFHSLKSYLRVRAALDKREISADEWRKR